MIQKLLNKDDTFIAYQKFEGKKPGIVFLGGFMSDMTGTKALYLEECCKRWDRSYIRFDYFGHGASSGKFEQGSIGRWLADVLMVLDQLTEGPQVLVGSSMGGWLMLLAALRRPESVHALVGIAAAPDFLDDFSQLTVEQQQSLEENGICYVPSSEGEGRPYPISRKLIEDGLEYRILNAPIAIDCPVHLLHGLSDGSVAWQKSVQLAERLTSKEVTVTLLKAGDHRLSTDLHLKLLEDTVQALLI